MKQTINRDDMIKGIDIYKDGNIFSSTDKVFQIPLYQRAYAWEQNQIEQLIEDIIDVEGDNYYLGSLVVADKGDYYEVIDGQQRLTTLLLLLYCIDEKAYQEAKKKLRFACRKRSNDTLDNLPDIMNNASQMESADVQDSMVNGVNIIKSIFKKSEVRDAFVKNISKVRIYRIIVPEHTDLNRYFEIMNTRGEQLELHHILKAQLMSRLSSGSEKDAFAMIWDACSEMNGYVQMNFAKGDRDDLFGANWQNIPDDALKTLSKSAEVTNTPAKTTDALSISDIIARNEPFDSSIVVDGDSKDSKIRFESIIDFPHFLVHALKVYENKDNQDSEKNQSSMIDDRKLLEYFATKKQGEDFSKNFINHLLRLRMLFDKYIIKREYIGDKDGEWSLKTIDTSGQQSNKKPYFRNTEGYYDASMHKSVVMIQSALRVSYTSPKVMHWITKLLKWVNTNYGPQFRLTDLCSEAERIAKEPVRKFLESKDVIESGGVATPHVVFNYLDYLLWKSKPDTDFVFEFRNSVEHWYPQNPTSSELEPWDDKDRFGDLCHRFGNLCLIQRNVNSKFSNLKPTAKMENYQNMIDKGSLKLRIMRDLTKDSGNNAWRVKIAAEHEAEMLEILCKACGEAKEAVACEGQSSTLATAATPETSQAPSHTPE